ncbi:hypothetical protein SETIT_5G159900v2 [Setaria italica]|uniref:C2H2-type domain-containing protein n=2 Tax=Setaria TaxID=4554 RepID=K3XQ06_SETIT|nr:hypothetical protein SETIT_5G159900v2 [Setaria italica]TKW14301.1 hypothetical protein SEVIR_5G159400v2 [Setaria viridis]
MNPPKDIKSTNNEPIVSPLHEALVGTTAMPIMDPSSQSQPTIQPIFHAQEPSNMPMNGNSMLPNCTEEPFPLSSLLPYTVPTTVTQVSSIPIQARFTANSSNQQQTFSSEYNFLTTPVSDYLSFSDHMAIMSMDAPPITSLLQGDPVAVLHAHLNTIQDADLGPIFENPSQVPVRVVASDNIVQSMSSSTKKNETGGDVFECKICPAKFFSAQAFGGHMSYHSKAMKKERNSTASTGTK